MVILEQEDEGRDGDPTGVPLHQSPLPIDAWISVLEFLPYRDVLSCSAVSRLFLRQIIPLIRSIEVYNPEELHIAPVGRFSEVTDVNINCLVNIIEDPEGEGHVLCKDTAGRLVHFLTRFPKLERAWVGGIDKVNYAWTYHFTYDVNICQTAGHEEVFRGLIRSVCGAYRSGVLRSGVSVDGLICSGFDEDNPVMFRCPEVANEGGPCDLCHDICSSFPLDWVMKLRQKIDKLETNDREWFSSRGAVCLSTRDRLSIVARRSGGAEFLASPSAISCCISKRDSRDAVDFRIGKRGKPSKRGRYNAVAIDLSTEILEEIQMVLQDYGFIPASHVHYEDIIQDYWRNGGGEFPPPGCCYMTRRTYEAFLEFGFSIKEDDFFLVDQDVCSGWQEGQTKHPNSGWTCIVPGSWKPT